MKEVHLSQLQNCSDFFPFPFCPHILHHFYLQILYSQTVGQEAEFYLKVEITYSLNLPMEPNQLSTESHSCGNGTASDNPAWCPDQVYVVAFFCVLWLWYHRLTQSYLFNELLYLGDKCVLSRGRLTGERPNGILITFCMADVSKLLFLCLKCVSQESAYQLLAFPSDWEGIGHLS